MLTIMFLLMIVVIMITLLVLGIISGGLTLWLFGDIVIGIVVCVSLICGIIKSRRR